MGRVLRPRPAAAGRRAGFGFRAPALLVSPYAKRGYVDHTTLDFTSILKFIEQNWGLKPLAGRDRRAHSIAGAFDFTQAPRTAAFVGTERGVPPVAQPRRWVVYACYLLGLAIAAALLVAAARGRGRGAIAPAARRRRPAGGGLRAMSRVRAGAGIARPGSSSGAACAAAGLAPGATAPAAAAPLRTAQSWSPRSRARRT